MDAIDFFCGAGGLTTAGVKAGLQVRVAVNHWRVAIDSHSANYPDIDHDCSDLSKVDVRKYPFPEVLLAAPECKYQGCAAGVQLDTSKPVQLDLFEDDDQPLPVEAHSRSRLTMAEVVRFLGASVLAGKPIQAAVVENVPEVRLWRLFPQWVREIELLGYQVQSVYFNAQFCGVPQSRDRVFFVLHRQGNRRPNLNYYPLSWCARCAMKVPSRQTWKKPHSPGGRYGKRNGQYYYSCPKCWHPVEPFVNPASQIIDWSLPCLLIGERKRPLTEATRRRIRAGLEKHAQAFLTQYYSDSSRSSSLLAPVPTITTANRHGLVVPPSFLTQYYGNGGTSEINHPCPTLTTRDRHALVLCDLRFSARRYANAAALRYQELEQCGFRMLSPHEVKLGMGFEVSYKILGNKKEQVAQAGQAVCPDAAAWIIRRVINSLN